MENLYQYSSQQPKGEDFSQYNNYKASLLSNDESFIVPYWPLPPHDLHVSTSASAAFQFCGFPSNIPLDGFAAEDKAAAASKSHSQAEKRRRDRINAQLATLRKLIPKSDKVTTNKSFVSK